MERKRACRSRKATTTKSNIIMPSLKMMEGCDMPSLHAAVTTKHAEQLSVERVHLELPAYPRRKAPLAATADSKLQGETGLRKHTRHSP